MHKKKYVKRGKEGSIRATLSTVGVKNACTHTSVERASFFFLLVYFLFPVLIILPFRVYSVFLISKIQKFSFFFVGKKKKNEEREEIQNFLNLFFLFFFISSPALFFVYGRRFYLLFFFSFSEEKKGEERQYTKGNGGRWRS